MVSRKQLEANRANAKRSTGPKSDAGKARSRMNALKHGFSSQEIVLEGENAEQFDALRAQLEAEFDPSSVIERELVDRLATLLWRLRRVPVLEAALIRARREEITPPRGLFISEEGIKDIRAYIEAVEAEQAKDNDNHGAQATSSAPLSVEATPPMTNDLSHRADSVITDPPQRAGMMQDHPNQLSSKVTGLALIKDSEDHDTLSKLSRYEAGLMNAVARTLSLIQAIQTSGLLPKK
jgi:hypothetical protein